MSVTTPAIPRPIRPWRRRLKRLVIALVACYLAVFATLLAMEDRFVFHPTPATVYWAAPPDDRFEEVTRTTSTGDHVHGWWLSRKGATESVFYCHGNSGNVSLLGPSLVNWSNGLNASVLAFDYPGYGKSTGVPTEAGCYAAAD